MGSSTIMLAADDIDHIMISPFEIRLLQSEADAFPQSAPPFVAHAGQCCLKATVRVNYGSS